MSQGKYRVTINGFRVVAETWDNAFESDGKRDEVFISASIKYMDKNGKLIYENQPTTPVMGDTYRSPGRIQAGSASDLGGLMTGDSFPSRTPWKLSAPILFPPERDDLPRAIWEGELTKGENMVFITPAIWEWDDGQDMFSGWLNWHKETDDKFGQKAKEIVAGVFPVAGPIFDAVSLGIQTAATLVNNGGPLGSSGSRPIGMKKSADDASGKTFVFNPVVLALDYETAKVIANSVPSGLGNGVLTLRYDDDPYLHGDYLLYVQVEEIGPIHVSKGIGESLGGELTSGPAVSSWSPGRLDVFALGTDNALWHKWYERGWNDWESLSGELTSDPAAISWANGRIDVFARGTDNALWHKWYEGGWNDWKSLYGVFTSGPAVSSWSPGRLDIFALGTDNALWHRSYEGEWGEWESLGGELTSDPAAVSWANGRIDVFARGTDNALWHKWYEGGWNDWESLSGELTSGPAVSSWSLGRLDVFVQGTDNALWHKWYDGGWNDWESLDGLLTSDPAAVSWANGRIDVFARGTDNALWHKFWDGAWRP